MASDNWLFRDEARDTTGGLVVERVLHFHGDTAQADAELLAPAIGDEHPTRKARLVGYTLGATESSVKQRGNNFRNYELRTQYAEKRPPENPLDIPVDWTGNTRRETIRTVFDGEGKPILNSAGSLVVVERPIAIQVYSAKKNYRDFPNWLLTLEDATNANSYVINGVRFSPGTLKFSGANIGDRSTDSNSGTTYKPVTFNVEHSPTGWSRLVPNTGREELTDDGLVPCVGDDGAPLTDLQWLDDRGRMYRDDDGNLRRDLNDSDFIRFEIEPSPRKAFPVLN